MNKKEMSKVYTAAGNILREDFLNYSLQNSLSQELAYKKPVARKTMLYLKSKIKKEKKQFVFDPEKKVKIGRDKKESNIYISNTTISQRHCEIYAQNNHIYLRDLNSSNGTKVKRGLTKTYDIRNGYQIELQTGDKIILGDNVFEVYLFFYDMSQM